MTNLVLLYPELEQFDGLPLALQSRLSDFVPGLQVHLGISFSKLRKFGEEFERHGIYHSASKIIGKNGRWADVDIAIEQKLYILTLGRRKDEPDFF